MLETPHDRRFILHTLGYAAAALAGGLLVLAIVGRAPRVPAAGPDPLTRPPQDFAWTDQPAVAFPIPPYAKYLAGVTIVLDPGHGGRADRANWKRGPTGLREAEVNLRVAQFLRDFLEAAGARVQLTREDDRYLAEPDADDLRMRVEIANDQNADLFLSIHHNAAAVPQANFTTVFHHGEPDDSPASLAAARQLLTGLDDALRLEQDVGCAIASDYTIYPGQGFAVLRQARVPAVLTESSFHSNPAEEQRLRDPLYNRREAYGLFLGLARWAQAGLPSVELVEPDSPRRSNAPLTVKLNDGLRDRGGFGSEQPAILASSIRITLNGEALPFSYNAKQQTVILNIPRQRANGPRELVVDFQNKFGQPVIHPRIELP